MGLPRFQFQTSLQCFLAVMQEFPEHAMQPAFVGCTRVYQCPDENENHAGRNNVSVNIVTRIGFSRMS